MSPVRLFALAHADAGDGARYPAGTLAVTFRDLAAVVTEVAFVRAELATMRQVWPHVVLLARAPVLAGEEGGNLVAVASSRPLDRAVLAEALLAQESTWRVATEDDVAAFAGDARVLTDDAAPVDQLLTPYGAPA